MSPAATRDFWYHFDGLNFQGSTLAMSWSTDARTRFLGRFRLKTGQNG